VGSPVPTSPKEVVRSFALSRSPRRELRKHGFSKAGRREAAEWKRNETSRRYRSREGADVSERKLLVARKLVVSKEYKLSERSRV
jgi:hypothetical protein